MKQNTTKDSLTGSDAHNRPSQPTMTGDCSTFCSGRNYYAVVRGFVYQLRAFATESEAQMFAEHLYSSPSFAPEFGWIASRKFGKPSLAVNAQQTDTLSPSTKNKP